MTLTQKNTMESAFKKLSTVILHEIKVLHYASLGNALNVYIQTFGKMGGTLPELMPILWQVREADEKGLLMPKIRQVLADYIVVGDTSHVGTNAPINTQKNAPGLRIVEKAKPGPNQVVANKKKQQEVEYAKTHLVAAEGVAVKWKPEAMLRFSDKWAEDIHNGNYCKLPPNMQENLKIFFASGGTEEEFNSFFTFGDKIVDYNYIKKEVLTEYNIFHNIKGIDRTKYKLYE